MFKRKTEEMPDSGQSIGEIQLKELFDDDKAETEEINESDASENATKDDIDNFIREHNNAQDAHSDILKRKSEFVTVTIPAGRMLGDVNYDGNVDMIDAALIRDHIAQTACVTDENAISCLDANNDGSLNVNDIAHARNVGRNIMRYGEQTDLSGEWLTNPNYREEYYQFYKDIAISGLTEKSSAIIFVPDRSVYDVIAKVECHEDVLRVYVTKCPAQSVKCKVQIFAGDGSADAVYSGESAFNGDFTVAIKKDGDFYTSDYYFQDIKSAHNNGENISLYYDEKLYILSHIDSSSALFIRVYANNPQGNMFVDAFMFIGEYVFHMNAEFADKEANYPQIARITIPKGRMIGDVNGDGLINKADVNLISKHALSNGTYLTDEIQIVCADTNPDGVIATNDRNFINSYLAGGCNLGRFSRDVLNNWTVNPNYEEEDGQFYIDVDIEGMTDTSSANIIIDGSGDTENYYAVCLNDKLRIYAKLCPVEILSATVIFYKGDGSCIIEFTSEVHPVRFDSIKIPAGRMIGDVNEDGKVNELDAVIINDYLAGRIEITDEFELMFFDADRSEYVNSSDADRARDVGRGALKYGMQPDLFENWTVNPDYKYEAAQFYTDIDVSGISESSSAVIFVPNYSVYEVIVKAECLDGKIRIYTKRCPISEANCKIQVFRGDGNAEVVYSGANVSEEKAKVLYFTNKIVRVSDFKSSSELAGYPYRARLALSGVTENHSVDVIFDDDDAMYGNYAAIAKTSNGYVSIYAKTTPSSTIFIPVIKCEKVVSL